MRDRVKIRLQIRIVYLPKPSLDVVPYRVDRLVGIPSRTKPVRAIQKVCFKDRLKDQQHGCLDNTIFDRGDTQGSKTTVRLGNIDAFHRLWPVALGA